MVWVKKAGFSPNIGNLLIECTGNDCWLFVIGLILFSWFFSPFVTYSTCHFFQAYAIGCF
jgi:hypothetical protein